MMEIVIKLYQKLNLSIICKICSCKMFNPIHTIQCGKMVELYLLCCLTTLGVGESSSWKK